MQIYSISKVLALPIVLISVAIMYLSYNTKSDFSIYIFIPVLFLVALYVFHGPLDHWWLSKYPVNFDPKLKEWLQKYFIPYQRFDESNKKCFEYRLTLYLSGRLFQSVGSEHRDVPEDIKCLVSAHGVYMFLGLEDYLIGDMDRIYLYKHPFPTPELPFLHSVEINTEDGVIILSIEQLTNAIFSPTEYYNVGYHAYAEAFMATQKDILYPQISDSWALLQKISGWEEHTVLQQTGLKQLNILIVHITLYFSMPEKYKMEAPELFQKWDYIFKRTHSS